MAFAPKFVLLSQHQEAMDRSPLPRAAAASPSPQLQMQPRIDDEEALECANHNALVHCQSLAMANFRAAVFRHAASNPSRPLTPARRRLIETRLAQFFPDAHTPCHPAYSAMIHRAIQELNEKGGSREESISNFIKTAHEDLPWAHSAFLKHHLQKLCESGEIAMTREGRYLLRTSGALTVSKPKRKQGRGHRKDGISGEEDQPKEEEMEMADAETQVVEEQNHQTEDCNKEGHCNGEPQEQETNSNDEWNQREKQGTGFREEQKQPEEKWKDVTEGQSFSVKEQTEGITKQPNQEKESLQKKKLLIRIRLPNPKLGPGTLIPMAESFRLEDQHEQQQKIDCSRETKASPGKASKMQIIAGNVEDLHQTQNPEMSW